MDEKVPENSKMPVLFGVSFPSQDQVENDADALKQFQAKLVAKVGEYANSPELRGDTEAQGKLNAIFSEIYSFGFDQNNFSRAEFASHIKSFKEIEKEAVAFEKKYFASTTDNEQVDDTPTPEKESIPVKPPVPPAPRSASAAVVTPPAPPTQPKPIDAVPETPAQPAETTSDTNGEESQADRTVPAPPPSSPVAEPRPSRTPDTSPIAPKVSEEAIPNDGPVVLEEPDTSGTEKVSGKFAIEGLGEFDRSLPSAEFNVQLKAALEATMPDLELRELVFQEPSVTAAVAEVKKYINALTPSGKKGEIAFKSSELPKLQKIVEILLGEEISTSQIAFGYSKLEDKCESALSSDKRVNDDEGLSRVQAIHIKERLKTAQAEIKALQKTAGIRLEGQVLEEQLNRLKDVQNLETILSNQLSGKSADQAEYLAFGSSMERDVISLLRNSSPETQQVVGNKLDDFKGLLNQLKDVKDKGGKFAATDWGDLVKSYQEALRDIHAERAELALDDQREGRISTGTLTKFLIEADDRINEAVEELGKDKTWSGFKKRLGRMRQRGRLFSDYKTELTSMFVEYDLFLNDPEATVGKFGVGTRESRIKKQKEKYEKKIAAMWEKAMKQKHSELRDLGLLANLPQAERRTYDDIEAMFTDTSMESAEPEPSYEDNIKEANNIVASYQQVLTLAAGAGVETAKLEDGLSQVKTEIDKVAGNSAEEEEKAKQLNKVMEAMLVVVDQIREEVKPNELAELGPIEDEQQFKAFRDLLKQDLELLAQASLVSEAGRFSGLFSSRLNEYKQQKASSNTAKLQEELDKYEVIFKSGLSEEEKRERFKEQWARLEDHLEGHYAALGQPYERTAEAIEKAEMTPVLRQYLDRDYRQFIADIDDDAGPYAEMFEASAQGDQELYKQGMEVYQAYQALSDNIKTADQNTELTDEEVADLDTFMTTADALWNKLSPLRESHLLVDEAEEDYLEVFGSNYEREQAAKSKFVAARSQMIKEALGALKTDAEKEDKLVKLIDAYYLVHAEKLNKKRLESLGSAEKQAVANSLLETLKSNRKNAVTIGASVVGAVSAYTIDRFTGGANVMSTAGGGVLGGIFGRTTEKGFERWFERKLNNWNQKKRKKLINRIHLDLLEGGVPDGDVDRLLLTNLKSKDRAKLLASSLGAGAGVATGTVAGLIASFIPPDMFESVQSGGEIPVEAPVGSSAGPGAPLSPEAVPQVNELINEGVAETGINLEQLQSDFINDLIDGTGLSADHEAVVGLDRALFGDEYTATEKQLRLDGVAKYLDQTTIDAVTEYIESLE